MTFHPSKTALPFRARFSVIAVLRVSGMLLLSGRGSYAFAGAAFADIPLRFKKLRWSARLRGRAMGGERMKRHRAALLALLVLAWGHSEGALALNPKKTLTQYVHDVWTVEDGLPQNSILCITQTRDGYLWVGTWGGLARFDGVRFTIFNVWNTPALRSNSINALAEDSEGYLWIGADGGGKITRFRNGEFTAFTATDGVSSYSISSICGDRQGNIWIGTNGGGIQRFRDGVFTTFTSQNGLDSNWIYAIYEDSKGRIWITTDGGLNCYQAGTFTVHPREEKLLLHDTSPIAEAEGSLWIGGQNDLTQLRAGRLRPYPFTAEFSAKGIKSLLQDREGNLWLGTNDSGLLRFRAGKFGRFTTREGLSHNTVTAIYEDREGSLWLGTWGGLNRLKDGKFIAFTTKEGLSSDWTHCLYEDHEGSLWVGTAGGGLNRLKDDKFSYYTTKNGLAGNIVAGLGRSPAGDLWIPTEDGGVSRFSRGRLTDFTSQLRLTSGGVFARSGMKRNLSHGLILAIHEDRQGRVWIGTTDWELICLSGGKVIRYTKEDGLVNDHVSSIYEDRQGTIWIGTPGGANKFRDGKLTAVATKAASHITSIYEDEEGTVWLTSRGDGLFRCRGEDVVQYTTREGLFDNMLTTVLDDGQRNLWLGSFLGIFRVRKQELEEVARGIRPAVSPVVYGRADGMQSVECNSHHPSGWKSRDGRLWFPTVKGLVVVDPNEMRLNSLAPPVLIEQLLFDKQTVDLSRKAELPPGRRDLEFHFTALSFLDPKKVRFKYRLEGYDKGWVEAGTRRVAYYTNLAPGPYRFRVIACNNDGVWNETGAAFAFYLQPRPYETGWFYGLCVAAGAAALTLVVLGLYHSRIKREQIRRAAYARQAIDLQEQDRRRIARDLHDSLGQLLSLITRYARDGAKESKSRQYPPDNFENITAYAEEAAKETHRITYNLQPPEIEQRGFIFALETLLDRYRALQLMNITCDIDQIDSAFDGDSKVHLYRLVQEGFNNIMRHSRATEAGLLIRREAQAVRIEIHDNGCGFAANGSRLGLGLPGITQRARLLGGRADIRSAPGQGTRITIIIPLPGGTP
jgi:ligand-binding sensor domain-containing protein/signal transduction histidine kinase